MSYNRYSVRGIAGGQLNFFAKGIDIDRAQALKTLLEAQGIGGDRSASGGYYGGIQNAIAVTNVEVVREFAVGVPATTSITDVLSLTSSSSGADGYFYFDTTQDIDSGLDVAVSGVAEADLGYEQLTDSSFRIFRPIDLTELTLGVSATYNYQTTEAAVATSQAFTDTALEINGTRTIFTTDVNYVSNTMQVTDSASGLDSVILNEGGGDLFELLEVVRDETTGRITKQAYQTGQGGFTVSFNTNSGVDSEDAPASGTYRNINTTPPDSPPFE